MDPSSLNPAFVLAAGRAAQCDVKQKSPCPRAWPCCARLPPPPAWSLQRLAEASGVGEGRAGLTAACCLPSESGPQPQPPFLGTWEVQGKLRDDGRGRPAKDHLVPLGTVSQRCRHPWRGRPSNGSVARLSSRAAFGAQILGVWSGECVSHL